MASVLGIDIGGANLKAAHTNGAARSVPFALWKDPHSLPESLRELLAAMPPRDLLAVTMTGELCDCFATKRDGVNSILESVAAVAGSSPVWVWSTHGRFLTVDEARADLLAVAAANWLAQATWAGRFVSKGAAFLIDMGSTTTDIIPLVDGRPVPHGRTDAQRLKTGELIYLGWRRTPVAAVLGLESGLMAEFFASTLDALLLEGITNETATNCDTADGRPATRSHAHARLARMLGHDGETATRDETKRLAQNVVDRMRALFCAAFTRVSAQLPKGQGPPVAYAPGSPLFVLSGSGEGVARRLLGESPTGCTISITDKLGPGISEAACAFAAAVLAVENLPLAG